MPTRKEFSKENVIAFIRARTYDKGIPPSIRIILKEFRTNRSKFYKLFRGLGEVYKLAGVDMPPERRAKIEPVLRAKRESEPDRDVNQITIDFRKDYESTRDEAKLDPKKLPEYLSVMLPHKEPDLLDRLERLGKDWPIFVIEDFSEGRDYVEQQLKSSIITGKPPVDFDEFLISRLRDSIAFLIEEKCYADSTPGSRDDKCTVCGSRVSYGETGSPEPLYCTACKRYFPVECPVCGRGMEKLLPKMVECGGCGYRLEFPRALDREFASADEYLDEFMAGRIRPGNERRLCVERDDGNGQVERVLCKLTWRKIPDRYQYEIGFAHDLEIEIQAE